MEMAEDYVTTFVFFLSCKVVSGRVVNPESSSHFSIWVPFLKSMVFGKMREIRPGVNTTLQDVMFYVIKCVSEYPTGERLKL